MKGCPGCGKKWLAGNWCDCKRAFGNTTYYHYHQFPAPEGTVIVDIDEETTLEWLIQEHHCVYWSDITLGGIRLPWLPFDITSEQLNKYLVLL